MTDRPSYLDFAATTPTDPRVAELVMDLMVTEFGNAGSRTHEFGAVAKKAIELARTQVADVVGADPSEVIFTSGATESDNLALLGLAEHGLASGRRHIVTTAIEHKAVLEPLDALVKRGFRVDHVAPDATGAVEAGAVLDAVQPDTLLVSVMHVNNETGIRQPIADIASGLIERSAEHVFLHTDAAQSFGKELEDLRTQRIDLISVSGHKLLAPKGIGALVLRRRDRRRPPLQPIMFGGGQERGLRPGTQPVGLIAGLGLAAELAVSEWTARRAAAMDIRLQMETVLDELGAATNGDPELRVPHILNISVPGIDSEAAILALRGVAAISNGSACTSSSYEPSHVLTAMGLDDDRRREAIRLSWGPGAVMPDAGRMVAALQALV